MNLDNLNINTIRFLCIDAIQKANSGHPGMPLGAAPMAYILWTRHLKHTPNNPSWFNRDRFILSAGHASMLLYSLLHLTGYDLSLEQLKEFRQWGSITPGHPERGLTPGVIVTTGPLGQGFGNGVGFAMAEAYLSSRYNKPEFNLIDHFTYAIVSDGDIMEGVAAEAASLAGHLKLGKLIYLYDSNRITLSESTELSFSEDVIKKFMAYGWHTQTVEDGNDLQSIDLALNSARKEIDRPSIILVKTHIGYGSPNKQDTFAAHGSPLGEEEVKLTKEKLGWPSEPLFHIPSESLQYFRQAIELGKEAEKNWNTLFSEYKKKYPELAKELSMLIENKLDSDWDKSIPKFSPDMKGLATRVASGKIIDAIHHTLPGFIGGSADLNPSTHSELKLAGDFEHPHNNSHSHYQGAVGGVWSYAGRNIHFGVREHAMGAILNGLSAHGGIIPFAATFLTFSDYMRPPIRLASLMQLQAIYVFTHDSIALGEDGPTHQPIEHLACLRAIPNLIVIRPADANETAIAWKVAIETRNRPVALVLSRQNVPTLDRQRFADEENLRKGAYILEEAPDAKPQIILIATGAEVSLIVDVKKKLQEDKISIRLISMPSWELFDQQSEEYRESIFPSTIPLRLAVEAGVRQGWHLYVGDYGDTLSIEEFGASAPGPIVLQKYGFTVENVCSKVYALLAKKNLRVHTNISD
ncbi:MAG: transketolase [Oligoflexia bacterium]|nr:transketolase [Oligoflexia bacterium]